MIVAGAAIAALIVLGLVGYGLYVLIARLFF
jgi:hypothetical protein